MRHFRAQFGPALEWPWTKLMDVPAFDDALVDRIASQSDAQSGHLSIRALERLRDDNLVGLMRALKHNGAGAGGVITAHEATLAEPQSSVPPSTDLPASDALCVTVQRAAPPSWADANGHVNEACYLALASQATDRFLETVGCDAHYVASGGGYFTLENHIQYLAETHVGDVLTVKTQVLAGAAKTLRLFHFIETESGAVAATVETLLIHVDLATRRSAPPPAAMAEAIRQRAAAHADQPWPDGAGRSIGQKPGRPADRPPDTTAAP